MPKRILPLTDLKIQKTKSQDIPITLFDGGGLYILITPSGGKLWRFKYRFDGKPKLLAFGKYPDVSLDEARRRREDARRLLENNVDPGAIKKAQEVKTVQEGETFEIVAREWLDKFRSTWTPGHARTITGRLEQNVFPYLGATPIAKIEAPDILAVLRRMEARGILESAHRVKVICGQVFRYAVATGRAHRDPTGDLRGAIPPTKSGHMAAITEPSEVGALLRMIDGYKGSYIVQCALKLQALTFVRPGELRKAEWSEIDLEKAAWNIPAEKMKMKQAHLVPLCRQAVEILADLHKLTGDGKYVFPGRTSDRPMSDNAILGALRRMGIEKTEMSGHGFRAMARTLLDEVLQFPVHLIEHQLAHAVRDPLGRAYNRTKHLKERRVMMETWADYLGGLKQGAKVLPFRQKENI
jgi:integrase